MSDRELNPELNDELLSAYLDGELSETERAAVEARLATDPDAQHTLQQLRVVSQSVQALPQASIGRDFREQILHRVEQAQPTPSSVAAARGESRLGDTLPQITIFRTKRSWVWASLVVAAGLLIMFLQSGDERDKNLPMLAKHDSNDAPANAPVAAPVRRSLEERGPERAIDSEQIAKTDLPAPMPAEPPAVAGSPAAEITAAPPAPSGSVAQAPATSAPPTSVASDRSPDKKLSLPGSPVDLPALNKTRDVAMNGAPEGGPGVPVGAAGPVVGGRNVELGANRESKVALDDAGKLSVRKPQLPQAPQSVGGGAVGGELHRMESARQKSAGEQNHLVVVHVVAKPESFKNKSFDQLLLNNGIAMESRTETASRSSIEENRLAKLAEKERVADKLADVRTAGEQDQNVDMVLVEAPQSAMLSFMSGLKNDSENYVGIEVDQPAADRDRADSKSLPSKKVVDNLSGYSRGVVPERQKELFRKQQSQYSLDTSGGSSDSPRGFGGGEGTANDASKQKDLREAVREPQLNVANQGRARRYSYYESQSRRGDDALAAAPAEKTPLMQRARKVAPKENANDMQVLFLVSPAGDVAAEATTKKAEK